MITMKCEIQCPDENNETNETFQIHYRHDICKPCDGPFFEMKGGKSSYWNSSAWWLLDLTHWGRVTHICVGNLTIIGSDNGLSPGLYQTIIWTNAEITLIGHLETNLSEIFNEIQLFPFKKMHLKMSSGKWRPFCLGLNVLMSSVK